MTKPFGLIKWFLRYLTTRLRFQNRVESADDQLWRICKDFWLNVCGLFQYIMPAFVRETEEMDEILSE
jgi:hypothetical protein